MKTTTPASAYMKANREVKMKQRAATDRSRSVDPSYRIDPSSYVDPASRAPSAEPSAEDLDKGRYEDEVSLCRAICDITAASPCCIVAACRDRPSESLDRFAAWGSPPEASQPRQGEDQGPEDRFLLCAPSKADCFGTAPAVSSSSATEVPAASPSTSTRASAAETSTSTGKAGTRRHA